MKGILWRQISREIKDLMEKYENPMEHACDIEEGQVFIVEGIWYY